MGVFMTNGIAWPRAGVLTAALLALALAGCQGSRLGALNTAPRAPAPLAAAPTGTVTTSQLPPPTTAGPAGASAFPEAPATPADAAPQTDEEMQLAAATAPDITAGSVAGVWKVSIAGQTCQMATPQTKYGQGFRAGPLACPAPLDTLKSWNVAGKQLALYDESGNVVARLYSSGDQRFDGQTSTGQPLSLFR